MEWIKLNQKEKLILTLTALIAFFVAYYIFILQPLIDNSNRLAAENYEKAQNLSQASTIDKLLKEIKLDNEMYESMLNSYTQKIPASFNIPDLLVNIGDICNEKGLDELFFIPDEPLSSEKYIALPVSFGVRGPFPEVVNMLEDLENITPMVFVKQLEIGRADMKKETVEARINFVIYSTGIEEPGGIYTNQRPDIKLNSGMKDPFFP